MRLDGQVGDDAVLKVFKYGEGILREKAVPVALVTDELRALADEMLDTMHATKGVGLAAQQVGRLEKMCVIDIPDGCEDEADALFNAPIPMPLRLFNPEIVMQEGSQKDKEGCLSFPGIGGSITRAAMVTCQYLDANGVPQVISARGFLARALQHEIDHLNGILYIDHMSAVERLAYAAKLKKLAKENGGVR
ncbi:MAG: peptide deformylase [Kiritimatiellae bacterium]|nr:peptide deformylase [Kiritimatiellia bacterium]